MPPNLVATANIMCSFGMAPSTLNVIRPNVMIEGKPAANMMDSAPMVNIPPFGMCMSIANPTVASATAAALGVLTPMPCVPATVGPWAPPQPTTMIGGQPAVTATAMCHCAYAGVITVVMPGAMRTITN